MDINFPWYLYPNQPCSGYKDYETYRLETIRLYNELVKYKPSKNTVFQLIIGAVMEEYKERNNNIDEHWRQLLPYYLENYLENDETNENCVEIFIVAPNNNFKEKINLSLIKETDYLNWIYDEDNKTYKSTLYDLTIKVFYTPFPSIQKNNNAEIKNYSIMLDDYDFTPIIQTENDITFVKNFYNQLGKIFDLIEKNKGVVLCNSYAVFRSDSMYKPIYEHYKLFNEIKTLFIKKKNRILAEWVFKLNNYEVYRYYYNNMITYTTQMNSQIPIFNSSINEPLKFITN